MRQDKAVDRFYVLHSLTVRENVWISGHAIQKETANLWFKARRYYICFKSIISEAKMRPQKSHFC